MRHINRTSDEKFVAFARRPSIPARDAIRQSVVRSAQQRPPTVFVFRTQSSTRDDPADCTGPAPSFLGTAHKKETCRVYRRCLRVTLRSASAARVFRRNRRQNFIAVSMWTNAHRSGAQSIAGPVPPPQRPASASRQPVVLFADAADLGVCAELGQWPDNEARRAEPFVATGTFEPQIDC